MTYGRALIYELSVSILILSNFVVNCNKIIVFSFDGFRYDYLDKAENKGRNISTFKYFIENGIHVKSVQNAFATFTIPSHYSMATGLYEETHGIIENRFYDPQLKRVFDVSNNQDMTDPIWFNNSETIWVTNQKNHHHSAIFYWVGSTALSKGHYPTYTFGLFNKNIPLRYEIDQILDWFVNDAKLTLGMIYYFEPDKTGHLHGPDSEKILDRIEEINEELSYLISRLKSLSLFDEMNLLLTSDHGMAQINSSRRIFLDQYINTEQINIYHDNCPFKQIWPKHEKYTDQIFSALNKKHPHLNVYKKSDIPENLHFKHNIRVAPIIVLADEGWSIETSNSSSRCVSGGTHGYDPKFPDMRPFLVGYGPAFKRNFSMNSIRSVDIYPLIAQVLQLSHLPDINGSVDNILPLLSQEYSRKLDLHTKIVYGATFSFVFLLCLIFCITAARQPYLYRASLIYRMTQPGYQLSNQSHKNDPNDQTKSLLIPVDQTDDDLEEL